jgi:hypothetical protein
MRLKGQIRPVGYVWDEGIRSNPSELALRTGCVPDFASIGPCGLVANRQQGSVGDQCKGF